MTKISIKELKTISLKKGVCYIKKDEEDLNNYSVLERILHAIFRKAISVGEFENLVNKLIDERIELKLKELK